MILVYCLQWYIVILLCSVVSFPIVFKVFKNSLDKGYCLSKALGLILTSLIPWTILSLLPGMVSFNNILSYAGIAIIGTISVFVYLKSFSAEEKKTFYAFFDKHYRYILLIEATMLLFIIIGGYLRGFTPDILAVHKLQEFVYIHSLLDTSTLPPENPWLEGYTLNIPYYGYFLIAHLVNLSGIELTKAFNLVPGTILGLIGILSGTICHSLTNKKLYGILGGFFAVTIANYDLLTQIIERGTRFPLDWWRSAHAIQADTLTPFALWSFTLGDLRPYFLVAPFILTITAILILNNDLFDKPFKERKLSIVFIALTSATAIMTDLFSILPILVLTIVFAVRNTTLSPKNLKKIAINLLAIFGLTGLLLIPFFLSYNIPFLLDYKGIGLASNLKEHMIVAGIFFIPLLLFVILCFTKLTQLKGKAVLYTSIALLSVFQLALLINNPLAMSFLTIIAAILLIFFGLYSIYMALKYTQKDKITTITFLSLSIIAITGTIYPNSILWAAFLVIAFFVLLLHKEISSKEKVFYALVIGVIGVYITSFLFKTESFAETEVKILSYTATKALLLMPILLTVSIFYTFDYLKGLSKDVYKILITLILLPGFIFLLVGPYQKSNKFTIIPNLVPNLSGYNHMVVFHEADHAGIEWIKKNTNPNDIILEGVQSGDHMTGRISAYAGRKTVLGWPIEQRKSYPNMINDIINKRETDINSIYSIENKETILPLLSELKVNYIVVGELERKIYPPEALEGFERIATPVFKATGMTIYRLNRDSAN